MNPNQPSKTNIIIRFILLGIVWVILAAAIIIRQPRLTLYHIFVIVASAIIIFVPLYKKYFHNGDK